MESNKLEFARKIYGSDFLGVNELKPFLDKLEINSDIDIPDIEYSFEELSNSKDDHFLILTIPRKFNGSEINILELRKIFGVDPSIQEPCFYNQDWYLNEDFVKQNLTFKWNLVSKKVLNLTRGINPENILESAISQQFPSATLLVYSFFAYYFVNKTILWKSDFLWTSDFDNNKDRIYVGRYIDETGLSKNGFSIHRHLSLRNCYGGFFVK